MGSVELTDSISSMIQMRHRLPGLISLGPTLPMNEILQAPVLVAQVNNEVHLVLLIMILCNVGGTGSRHRLTQESVMIGFDTGNVDNGVNTQSVEDGV